MASLKELMTMMESNYRYKCNDCGSEFGCGHDRLSAMEKCDGDKICEQEQGCKECKSTNIVEIDKDGNVLTENKQTHQLVCKNCGEIHYTADEFGCEDHKETMIEEAEYCDCGKNAAKEPDNFEVREIVVEAEENNFQSECEEEAYKAGLDPRINAEYGEFATAVEMCKQNKRKEKEANVEMVEAVIEMIENDALTTEEKDVLMETIEDIFNGLLNESADYEDDYEETYYICNDDDEQGCDWEGPESELESDEDGEIIHECPYCGSSISEMSEDEEIYEEGLVLGKTSMKDRMASKKYGMTAAGKKAKRKSEKKRAKYAAKIDACSEKGKTFSFKDMTCVKTKKRRGTKK